jgi:phosphatidylethanolamine/phosphatidyl-N-methylethanolamine N-methyltransferase
MDEGPMHRTNWTDRLAFLGEFFRSPLQVASIVPSTRFVERQVARRVADCPGVVVELGAGTGGVTQALLSSISRSARLIAVELNPVLAARVARIGDPRLVVHCGSAEELPEVLRAHGCIAAAAVVSGLPFSTIPRARALRVLSAVERSLAPGGEFVAYHARDTLERLVAARRFRTRLELVEGCMAWINIPPLRIYRWRCVKRQAAQVDHVRNRALVQVASHEVRATA